MCRMAKLISAAGARVFRDRLLALAAAVACTAIGAIAALQLAELADIVALVPRMGAHAAKSAMDTARSLKNSIERKTHGHSYDYLDGQNLGDNRRLYRLRQHHGQHLV